MITKLMQAKTSIARSTRPPYGELRVPKPMIRTPDRENQSSVSPQQLERVDPVLAQEAGDAPQDAQGLDRPRCLDESHIRGLPTELVEKPGHGLLGGRVVAADEHRRFAPLE